MHGMHRREVGWAPGGSVATRPRTARPLVSLIGNRGVNALLREGIRGRGIPLEVAALAATTPRRASSPPTISHKPEEIAAVEDGLQLTNPPKVVNNPFYQSTWQANPLFDPTSTPPSPVAVQEPDKLTVKGRGSIEGKRGISEYWPGVTPYWGGDKTLGEFDKKVAGSPGWRMIGHKFQTIGRFTTGTTTAGAGGEVQFLQEARITTSKGGAAGAWFDDMDYTDAWGGAHNWDPNAEAGTNGPKGYPGVRRTIATNKVAYTDPPAMPYQPGVTNDYRKLEFRIHLKPPPGASKPEIIKYATQEIEIVNGKPKVLKKP